jgi:hypothetical protein
VSDDQQANALLKAVGATSVDAPMELFGAPKPNGQLFTQSPLRNAQVTQDYYLSGDKLEASKEPNLAILHEKPEHRLLVYLKAQGKSNRQCAELMGFTESWISQITRQPWFRKRLVETLSKHGGDAVEAVLKTEALASVETLIELRDNAKSDATKLAATNSLLDRIFGKPTQHIKTERMASPDNAQDEMSKIDKELAELRAQQKLVGLDTSGDN